MFLGWYIWISLFKKHKAMSRQICAPIKNNVYPSKDIKLEICLKLKICHKNIFNQSSDVTTYRLNDSVTKRTYMINSPFLLIKKSIKITADNDEFLYRLLRNLLFHSLSPVMKGKKILNIKKYSEIWLDVWNYLFSYRHQV